MIVNVSRVNKDTSEDNFRFQVDVNGTGIRDTALKKDLYAFEIFIEGDLAMKVAKYGAVTIQINDVTSIKRLKAPYKSNCTDGENDLNVFPPPYTRQKCKDTRFFHDMLAHCGDVPNHWQRYVRPHHIKGWDYHEWDPTDDDILECIHEYYRSMVWYKREDKVGLIDCPLPCFEIVTENVVEQAAVIEKDAVKNAGALIIVDMKIPSLRITNVNEIETFTLDDFFTDLGSWLGLLVGMSLLSLVEIAAFVYTVIREKCS